MKKPLHILMTGAGAPGAAGIIKCLLQEPSFLLSVADADNNAIGRYIVPRFFQIPKAGDENFTEALLTLCRQENIDLVLPLVTRELFPLSQNKQVFKEAGINVIVSSPEAIRIANDKAACYQYLKDKGVPVPQFFTASTVEEFEEAAAALLYPGELFCFKPAISNGSRGFRVVSDHINEAEQLFQQKPYQTFITFDHVKKILSSQPFPPLVVSAFLPGEEYSVDCIADKGKTLMVVPRLRQKMINGISVQGKFVEADDIIQYCTNIIAAIGLHGNIGIQVRRSKEGEPLLLEINPRVQGTIVAALGAGVNLPLLAVKNELQMPVSADEQNVQWGLSFSRHWTEVFY